MVDAIPMGQATVQKDLIPLESGKFAEAIYFNRPEKQVVCFSTQLSCAVGCAFCASPGPETTVNLTAEEMLLQINTMMETYSTDSNNITLFSVMGEGEPLLNYKNVLQVIHELPVKYPYSRISLSTSGVALDKIKELAHEEFTVPFKLQVSMHTLDDDVRAWFMPLAKPVADVKQAIDYYHANTDDDRPVELNFALIKDVNDTLADAERIIKMFPTEHIKISQFNPIIRSEFESPSKETMNEFVSYLRNAGLDVEYHQTDGSGIGAACGQTRGMRV